MAVVMFDEAIQHSLEKWTSDGANLREELRSDAALEALGATLGLRSAAYGAGDNPGLSDRAWACIEPGSFAISSTGALSLTLGRGLAVGRDNGATWVATGRSLYRWLYLAETQAFSLNPCLTPGNTRLDIVLLRPALYQADPQTVAIKTVAGPSGTYVGQTVDTKYRYAMRWGTYAQFLTGAADACVKEGIEDVAPVEPTVDAGAVKAWTINVTTTDHKVHLDWRRMPRSQRPRMSIRLTMSATFDPLTDVEILAEEGIVFRNASRTSAGRYTVQWFGTPGPTRPTTALHPDMGTGGIVVSLGVIDCGIFGAWPQRGAAIHPGDAVGWIYCQQEFAATTHAGAGTDTGVIEFEILSNDYDGGVWS